MLAYETRRHSLEITKLHVSDQDVTVHSAAQDDARHKTCHLLTEWSSVERSLPIRLPRSLIVQTLTSHGAPVHQAHPS